MHGVAYQMKTEKFEKTVRSEVGKMSTHIINDNYIEAEKALRSGVATYVANAVAKNISDIRKQEQASRR